MFEAEIAKYDALVEEYLQVVGSRIHENDLRERHEVLFSAHSCAINVFFKQAMLSLQNDINNKTQANSFGRKMMFVF